MKIIEYIKAAIWLVIVSFVAVLGLSHSFYGLMVSVQNSELYEIDYSNINNEDIIKNRYISIKNAGSYTEPLVYIDERNKPIKYLYALTQLQDSNSIHAVDYESHIVIESETEIHVWKTAQFKGLLSPYWDNIDEDIKMSFELEGIVINENAEFLKLETEPWKWYWHILIILLASLFFYRMFEALFKKMKKSE